MSDIQFTDPSGAVNQRGSVVDFQSPWLDYSSAAIPNSLTLVLRWAEYLWNAQGTYRQALQRTVRYFITDLQISDVDDEKMEDIKDILEHNLKVRSMLSEFGDNFVQYGNIFLVRHVPFKRFLSCRCGNSIPFDVASEQKLFEWKAFEFQKTTQGCGNPKCTDSHSWTVSDSQSKDPKDFRILMLNPHEMEIGFNPYTKAKKFFWNIPPYLVSGIEKGVPIILRETPWEIVEACKTSKRLELDDSVVFHAAEPASAGFYTGGWGIPRVISNFRLAFHHQTLCRFDLAIAMDYINGMRVISPDTGSSAANGAGDPLLALGGSMFRSSVLAMTSTHRKDPASWQVSPFPLKYQLFGGEGQQLSPKELLKLKLDEWLDASGIPAELYHGSLTVQAAPMALRIFENAWPEITALYNNILEWVASYLMEVMELPKFRVELLKPRLADDLERRQIILQLMGGNQISPQTALQTLGILDPRHEIRQGFEWQEIAAQEEKEHNDRLKQLEDSDMVKQQMAQRSAMALSGGAPMDAMAGGMPPGGAPGPSMGGPSGGAGGAGGIAGAPTDNPEAMVVQAQQIAQQIMAMDPPTRRRSLVDLKKQNSSLHSVVKGMLSDMERDAGQQGVQQARQQAQQQGPAAGQ